MRVQKAVGLLLHLSGRLIFYKLADDGGRLKLLAVDLLLAGQIYDILQTGNTAGRHRRSDGDQKLSLNIERFGKRFYDGPPF